MRAFLATAIALGVSIGVVVACGVPSSFDHLTGGPPLVDAAPDAPPPALVEDVSLEPPRPKGPLSTSWLNGSRPHFQWELTAVGSTGAQVIVCRDAACSGDKKTFSAAGKDLVAPEDLATGLWYWHLVSTTASTFGSKASATWTMLVRGGTGTGAPAGAFNDMNGDGIPDLLVSVLPGGTIPGVDVYLFLGTKADDPTAFNADPLSNPPLTPIFGTNSVNARVVTTDVDGDGLDDVIWSDGAPTTDSPTTPIPFVAIEQGSSQGGVNYQFNLSPPTLPSLDALPFLVSPGDTDGDGHGDLLASTLLEDLGVFGATDGLVTLSIFDELPKTPLPDAGELPLPTSPIALTGYDWDGDGLGDVVITSYFDDAPFSLLQAKGGRQFTNIPVKFADGTPATTPPTAFTSGDIDGDGKNDLVFVTNLATKPSVCVFGGAEQPLLAHIVCWTPATPPATGFASGLAVADLDGDGKDEILVGTAAGGVDVLSSPAAGQLVADHLAIDYGSTITVIVPGRPTPAVWAATRADGTSIGIYRGKDLARTIAVGDFGSKFASALR